jgi:hypothetical protein
MNNNHCGKMNCRCTHTDGCVKGFIEKDYVIKKFFDTPTGQRVVETKYEGVVFCSTCDPERAHIQNTSRSSEEMTERLRARSHSKSSENYQREESSKTRTL